MNTRVIKKVWLPITCCVALSFVFFHVPEPCHGFEITIEIAPSTLNLQNQGEVVTVHTDIGYNDVDVSSVYLNGESINSWKADDRGYFVAKFLMEDIKLIEDLKINEYNTMTLVGVTKGGDSFIGEQDIKVIDIEPSGRKL